MFRINPHTGEPSLVTQGGLILDIRAIEVVGDQALVTSWSDSELIALSLSSGTQSLFAPAAQGLHRPWGLAWKGGDCYLGAYDTKWLQKLSGGVLTNWVSLPGYPLGVGFDLDGNILVGTTGANAILRVTPTGVIDLSISSGLISEVTGLTVAPLSLAPTISNTAPRLSPLPDQKITAGQLLVLPVSVFDSDSPAQTLTFSLQPGAPAGASISSSGLFSWRPNSAYALSTNTLTIKVSDDGDPVLSDTVTFKVMVDQSNLPPVLAPIADRTALAGDTLAFSISAIDPNVGAHSLFFSLAPGAPAGASISPGGNFFWQTDRSQAGSSNRISIQVTDDGLPPLSAIATFNVSLHSVMLQTSPNLTGPFADNADALINSALRQIIVATGANRCFFRLRSTDTTRLSGMRCDGSKILFDYAITNQ